MYISVAAVKDILSGRITDIRPIGRLTGRLTGRIKLFFMIPRARLRRRCSFEDVEAKHWFTICSLVKTFLDASSHLYSIRGCVRPSVRWSIRPSISVR